ncbi:MAG: hypothetical protein A2052_03570 [Deltaproteobacteria bacterium GWA2_54_12]|nr:MAG: hypothetical protein A2052_03570 [Deltaproteobacteria bacterium GWA2_54_12]
MKSIKDRSSLLLILLPIWLVAVFGVFKAEWVSLNFLPTVMFNAAEKDAVTSRPIDRLALKAESLIPPGSKVFFFDPYPWDSPQGGFYAGRLRYQLYQREMKVISPADEFDYRSMGPGDFAAFIWPDGIQPIEKDLAALAGMEELYSQVDARGRQSVYRVVGAGR